VGIWSSLRSNWPVKASAFAIGLVLWAHVKTDRSYEDVVPVPLVVSESSGRFVVANELPTHVNVQVKGTGKELLFASHRGRVVLRPRISKRQAITMDIGVEHVEGIAGDGEVVAVGIMAPTSVHLDFDYQETREVPVEARVGLRLRDGYTQVGDIAIAPPSVRIRGPRRFVRGIKSVFTDSVSFDDVAEATRASARVELPPHMNLIAMPGEVTMGIEVQVLVERRLMDIPIRVVRKPRSVQVTTVPEFVTVDVKGGDKVIGAFTDDECVVELNYRLRYIRGLDDLDLRVRLPDDVRLVRVSPATASLVMLNPTGRAR